ncbi:3-keto-disaccharide hydrolase [Stieleria varia]|uniref:3-keto-alpha-glucoside-1,2-lyase/3-keto-2-hydroxy-glucal hydratase domain-containing protein n=1 Tax=Stieleria varia TaxID=2528005 RepID=A0A5C6AZY5_9BACT|nr:DUF1080 domain-containing protein [Stieleria varia]TWU04759.1 hypothetical protein Pla52n_28030 [Stieleria varia]
MLFDSLYRTRCADKQRNCPVIALVAISLCCATAIADDWVPLFDGKSLDGWNASGDNKQFQIVDGVIRGASSGKTHFLCTEKEYRDFELEIEVKLHDMDLNSGIQIRTSTTRANAKGDTIASVHGPQVDLGKSPGRSGHIFGQGNGRWFTPTADLERNSLMINGAWNKVRILAKGKHIQTWINGELVGDVTLDNEIDQKYPQGVIALQVHGVKSPDKIRHVSFRNIRIREPNSVDTVVP